MGTSDMLKWYLSFYSKPEWIGLSKATRDAMLTPFIEGYAQGIGVGKPDPLTHWPPHVSYIGGIGSFFTEMGMWTNTVDPKSSDVVAVWVNRGLLNLPEAVRKGESCSDPDTGKVSNSNLHLFGLELNSGWTFQRNGIHNETCT